MNYSHTRSYVTAELPESVVLLSEINLLFIYVGKGKMTNPRRQEKYDKAKGKNVVTYLYDIVMENELPDYLQYDFGLTK